MKKLILAPSIMAAALLSTSLAFAEGDKDEGGFANFKAKALSRVKTEKDALDQFATCVNAAKEMDDMKKCHEAKRAAMEKSREKERDERRTHLQNELKKLDEEGKKK